MRSWGTRRSRARTRSSAATAQGYLDWLKTLHEESHGNADLVAHFFRRAFDLLRQGGAFGLIATNTIGQGDTRSTGLRWICKHGGTIFAATRRKKWPGLAAVVISVVHVHKGPLAGPFDLDGRPVPIITAYLFHAGGHDDPEKLQANDGKSFQGSIVLGMGFTFDDTAPMASPIQSSRCTADRQGPAQRRAHLPLHRRRGGQRQPDPRPPPLCHQLRRDDRGRGKTVAGLDENRGGEGQRNQGITFDSGMVAL